MRKPLFLSLALSVLNLVSAADAQETRIYYLGNSLTDELKYDYFKKLAETQGHKIAWGRQMCPGIPIRGLWGLEGGFVQPPFGPWKRALREYEWDFITLQPFCPFQGEYEYAILFAQEVIKKSRDVQICIYAQWPGKGKGADWDMAFSGLLESRGKQDAPTSYTKMAATVPDSFKDRLKECSLRNEYELIVLGLRQNVPTKKPTVLIPAGHVMQLLGQKMRAGLMPGYRTPWDFYSDGVHVNNDGSYLVACSFYATIFKKSPVGLPIGDYQGKPGEYADGVRISPKLAKIIQETVWEVVATHPLTGVTSGEPLRVANPLLYAAVAGEPYRFELLPAFGQGPYTWSLAQGSLPDGIELRAEGVLVGAPSKDGKTEIALQVADGKGATAQKTFTLVVEKDVPPAIPEQPLPAMNVGAFLEHRLKSESGNGIHRWLVKDGSSLPPGLTLDSDGRLWGAPGKEGRFETSLVAVDSDLAKPERAERTFVVAVAPAQGEVAFARHLAAAPTLKPAPVASEWQFRYPISKLVHGEKAAVKGSFDLAWTAEKLYVAVSIDDSTLNKGGWAQTLTADNVILCLDTFNNREATYNADDWYLPYPRGHIYPQRSIMMAPHLGYNCTQAEREGGYLAIFEISWRSLGLSDPMTPCRVIGLDVMVVDNAKDGVPAAMVVWQGTKNNATDPSKFGTVGLSEFEGDKR